MYTDYTSICCFTHFGDLLLLDGLFLVFAGDLLLLDGLFLVFLSSVE